MVVIALAWESRCYFLYRFIYSVKYYNFSNNQIFLKKNSFCKVDFTK